MIWEKWGKGEKGKRENLGRLRYFRAAQAGEPKVRPYSGQGGSHYLK